MVVFASFFGVAPSHTYILDQDKQLFFYNFSPLNASLRLDSKLGNYQEMLYIFPKHTHLCYKMAIFNKFEYFDILPIPYSFSKFPELFQSTNMS